jgi:hypothetical protein
MKSCQLFRTVLAVAAFASGSSVAFAIPVRFDYSGSNSSIAYTGWLSVDDSLFDGSGFQHLFQSQLLDFSMTAVTNSTTFTWGLADLIQTNVWFFDSTTPVPDIVGQGGYVSNLHFLIAAGRGHMSSSFGNVNEPPTGNGDWTYAGPVAVPEPMTLSLLGAGLFAVAALRRRKNA